MTRAALAGWLLVTSYGGTIAWYETKDDCVTVSKWAYDQSWIVTRCFPDRQSIDEVRKP
jgi:hypothetical protein